jgi:hypothetical protein
MTATQQETEAPSFGWLVADFNGGVHVTPEEPKFARFLPHHTLCDTGAYSSPVYREGSTKQEAWDTYPARLTQGRLPTCLVCLGRLISLGLAWAYDQGTKHEQEKNRLQHLDDIEKLLDQGIIPAELKEPDDYDPANGPTKDYGRGQKLNAALDEGVEEYLTGRALDIQDYSQEPSTTGDDDGNTDFGLVEDETETSSALEAVRALMNAARERGSDAVTLEDLRAAVDG